MHPLSHQTDEQFMKIALTQAKSAAADGEIPVGAVLVKDGTVVAQAHNKTEGDRSPLAHAELLCIEQACKTLGDWRLDGCTLYVTLEPCPMCAGAILNSRISRVVFGLKDPKAGCFGSLMQMSDCPFAHKVSLRRGVYEAEAKSLLQDFFDEKRKKKDAKPS